MKRRCFILTNCCVHFRDFGVQFRAEIIKMTDVSDIVSLFFRTDTKTSIMFTILTLTKSLQ
jgi:hypothetical protein